jgi:hypothetical protein
LLIFVLFMLQNVSYVCLKLSLKLTIQVRRLLGLAQIKYFKINQKLLNSNSGYTYRIVENVLLEKYLLLICRMMVESSMRMGQVLKLGIMVVSTKDVITKAKSMATADMYGQIKASISEIGKATQ